MCYMAKKDEIKFSIIKISTLLTMLLPLHSGNYWFEKRMFSSYIFIQREGRIKNQKEYLDELILGAYLGGKGK